MNSRRLPNVSDAVIEDWKRRLPTMSQMELARLYRFSPSGHPVFRSDLPLYDIFQQHFKGFTSAISKEIDLDT